MKRGITNITDAKRGITQISKIMRGTVLIWEKVVAWAQIVVDDYETRVLADSGIVEDKPVLQTELELGTEQDYLDAIDIYNPNGGYKTNTIYDVRNSNPKDFMVVGGGGTRVDKNGSTVAVAMNTPKIDYSTGKAAFRIERVGTNGTTTDIQYSNSNIVFTGDFTIEISLQIHSFQSDMRLISSLGDSTNVGTRITSSTFDVWANKAWNYISFSFSLNTEYKIKIESISNIIKVFIDDVQIGSISSSAKIYGFRIGKFSYGNYGSVGDYSIYSLKMK